MSIHVQSFYLKEHRIMRRVRGIPAEHPSRGDDPQRRLLPFHRVNLDIRCLSPESERIRHVEGVSGVSRGMRGRDVQGVEVVKGGLDFRAVLDRVAHRNEYIFDTLTNKRDRVKVSSRGPGSGQSHIYAFAKKGGFFVSGGNLHVESFDLGLDFSGELVDLPPELGAFVRAELAYILL